MFCGGKILLSLFSRTYWFLTDKTLSSEVIWAKWKAQKHRKKQKELTAPDSKTTEIKSGLKKIKQFNRKVLGWKDDIDDNNDDNDRNNNSNIDDNDDGSNDGNNFAPKIKENIELPDVPRFNPSETIYGKPHFRNSDKI